MLKRIVEKITGNAYGYSVFAKLVAVLTGLLYTILYSRYLGSELRGMASVITNYSEMIMLILCFGAFQAYPYFKKTSGDEKYPEFINNVFGLFFLYAGIAAAFLLIVRPSANVCVITALIPSSMAIRQLLSAIMIENPRIRNTAQIGLELFDIVFLALLMLFTEANYFYCILFLVVRNIVSFAVAVQNLKVPLSSIHPTLRQIWPYIRYGFLPMLTIILMEVNYKVDVMMLDRMGIADAQIGVYSLGVMLAQKLWMIPEALKGILMSKLANGKNEDEVARVTRVSLWITVACVLGMVCFGRLIIRLLFGEEYSGAYAVFLNISLGVIGMVFYKMIYAYNVVNGHKNINFILLAIAAVVNVVLNFFLIPALSINGAALASMASYSMCGIGFLIHFIRSTGTPVKDILLVKKEDVSALINYIKK